MVWPDKTVGIAGFGLDEQDLFQSATDLHATLESGIDVGQGITVGPGKFVKKNKRRALNKRRA